MGFLRNKGRNIKQPTQSSQSKHYTGTNNISTMYRNTYHVELSTTKEGYLCVELIELNKTSFDQFYDTTRLIVRGNPKIMGNGIPVQDCLVSYYGQSDVIFLNEGQEFGRRTDYNHILAEFDINQLISNEIYAINLMRNLLNEKRVQKYLNEGMKDNSQQPCGIYVGGITPEGKKYFKPNIGIESHYSPSMQQKRAKNKENKLRSMQSEYYRNCDEIDRLEKRNQDLKSSMDGER